jgi:hypothetical protein
VFELLAQGFAYLVEATMDESGSLTYTDVLGETYMEFVQHGGSGPLGQYFTPQHVTKLMAAITMSEVDALVKQRIREALEKSPEAQVMGLVSSVLPDPVEGGGTTWRYLLPLLAPYYQPVLVLDPCVGSGRMLLAAAEAAPRVYTDLGLIQFYGMDIDPTCVQMTRINTMLYGLNGWSYVMEKQGRPAVQVPVRGEIVEVERAPEGVIARLPEPVRSAYQELRLDPVRTDRARLRKRVVEGQMGMFSEEPELPIAK